MSQIAVLLLAMLLDALLGEPDWLWRRLPHPAVLMGRMVGWCDKRFNTGAARQARGLAVILGLALLMVLLGRFLEAFGALVEILVVAVLLAQRSLVVHVQAVADGLRMSLGEGRRQVGMIVSRDTGAMSVPAVSRSAIESAAENLSDGIIAPAFWFLLGGLPGLLVYKVVNTADSMIGYRTPRYEAFGKAAARLDDLMNWLPARLTALLIALQAGGLGQWAQIAADARLHKSPNAGWPEAAMARSLDVALAGPRAYDGQMRDFAWVNPAGRREIGPMEIDAAVRCLWRTWALFGAGLLLIGLLA